MLNRQRSFMAKAGEVTRAWHLVDATDKVLGRLASRIALVLQGKHLPTYTPHVDAGDFVVVVNAEKVAVTGRKEQDKVYRRHTYYMGGLREEPLKKMRAEHPDRIIRLAVKRMLPKSDLGRKMLGKLKVYRGPDHPHQAQNPAPVALR
ncbi:MAG: 50S ribosomal protein L13 [Planctomycetes bacterium]|nr:50S ribosomal protein L13 [Planctomycetota bacterium]